MAKKMYFCSPPQCLQMTNTADYICALISDLLYEHRQLHLPGLGAFLLQYKPAVVDNVQGQLLPPSLDLSFDTRLVMDDGLLLEQLQQRTGWTAEVAAHAISNFVDEIQAQLSRGELVHLPNIGRLHSNHENAIVFKADNYNYHKDAFGLPVIQATVAARPAAATAATAQAANPTRSAAKGGGMRPWFWVFGLLALLTGGMIYASLYVNRLATEREAAKVAAAEAEAPPSGGRINVAPSADLPEEPAAKGEVVDQERSTVPADEAAPEARSPKAAGPASGSTAAAAKAETPATATKPTTGSTAAKPAAATTPKAAKSPAAATPAPAGKTVAWVSVGKFGSADNAARMNQRIAAAGYEPFSTEEDGLTRVGVLLTFSTEAELQQQLRKISSTFSTKAFVVKREPLRN